MELTLSQRLQVLADSVASGAVLADVGTDHGYLPASLLLGKKIPFAIASDLRAGPLERARETARRFGVEQNISFRQGAGLSVVGETEADIVVIAGMGGETIAGILAAAPWTRDGKQLLLQPMTHGEVLRGWLSENGYRIERESLAQEGKRLYCAMEVKGGAMSRLSPAELWAGRQSEDPLRGAWLEAISAKVSRMLAGRLGSQASGEKEVDALQRLLWELEQMRKEL